MHRNLIGVSVEDANVHYRLLASMAVSIVV